ncbi:hypothetical protein E2C01_098722 [Portunus trituberculatus]|uniref:Uncharacterized protein n=1 Tax=Portunus trituberculatus TaxID=210409 RepID=A0A5B7K3M8_PORTR|nr:hypothetical protein [Portunus trituberculatus]
MRKGGCLSEQQLIIAGPMNFPSPSDQLVGTFYEYCIIKAAPPRPPCHMPPPSPRVAIYPCRQLLL